ncbi:unnamed protein product, partial [Pocillopora meandrina]
KTCLQFSYGYGFSTDFLSLQSKHNYWWTMFPIIALIGKAPNLIVSGWKQCTPG